MSDDIIFDKIEKSILELSAELGKSKEDIIIKLYDILPKIKEKKTTPSYSPPKEAETTKESATSRQYIPARSAGKAAHKGNVIKLHFIDGEFVHNPKSSSDSRATVEINLDAQTVLLSLPSEASLITRRTASRQAESIAKSGFVLDNNERVATGFKYEVQEANSALSEAHTRVGHSYNQL
ncbi:MAG: hypothetical protein INQ03_20505 [Candidatus Heimdallarchaeota archaeon]|nr:hypothetical protein [Candidatus Heimdallarchaeota archaeon]